MSKRKQILDALASGPSTAADLALLTGIPENSVKSAIANLIHEKKVSFEEQSRAGRVGKAPSLYSLRAEDASDARVDPVVIAKRSQPNSVFALGAM